MISEEVLKKIWGEETDKVLGNHPTIEHPSRVFMSSLINGLELSSGTLLKAKDEVIRQGSSRPVFSRKLSMSDY